MLNIILCGAPGSGKGTQSEPLVRQFGLEHLSTGDVLREEIKSGSPLGQQIDALISKGEFVPDEHMITLIEQFLDSRSADCKGVIFDGFPRTLNQAHALTDILNQRHLNAVMIDLQVDEQEVIQRLINRGKTSGRADDNEATIRERLAIYHQRTQPIAQYYSQLGNYYPIDGNGSMQQIAERIHQVVSQLV